MAEEEQEAALLGAIGNSADEVQPVATAGKRALLMTAVGMTAVALVPVLYELRGDAAQLGVVGLWGASAIELGIAALLLRTAFAEGTPGQLASTGSVAGLAFIAVSLHLAVVVRSYQVSPAVLPAGMAGPFFRYCFVHLFAIGAALLAPIAWAMRRGLFARPWLAATLAGLGSGIMADASWRVFCHMSAPGHMLPAHSLAILTVTLVAGVALPPLKALPRR